MGWNYATIYEAIAKEIPDLPCQVQGDRELSWAEFDRSCDALAGWLLDAGLPRQAKVGIYLRNRPEFLVAYVGCLKARLVPVNVNFRYGHDELRHVFSNADIEAVVFQSRYAASLAGVRTHVPDLKHFLCVGDGNPAPSWAAAYGEVVVAQGPHSLDRTRSGDDALLLYTGGTTGLPKGVVWRQDEVIQALGRAANFYLGRPPARDLDDVLKKLDRSGKRLYVACPLIHATGLFTSLSLMNEGWAIETSAMEHFDPAALLHVLGEHQVNALVIVGDAFARPLLAEFEADPDGYDLSHLEIIISSGSAWSQRIRAATLERLPWVLLCDNYGSSEALRGVQTYSRPGDVPADGVIAPSERLEMMDDGRLLDISVPGNGGALLIKGHLADRYYHDPERSATTWLTIEGERRCVTGDHGVVEPDGSIRLLGRGSAVVNTGGEKVYPQEVEGVIRQHKSVADAAVVGLPNERFGQVVTAVVQVRPGTELALSTLAAHVKRHLAGYKAPRELIVVPAVPRTSNGKIDYNACEAAARAALNEPAAS